MNTDVKVSVICPVYNAEKYLEDFFKNVKNQAFKDYELIVVNDGSTDNSMQIIEKYARADERIKFYNKENGGVASARNLGIKKAEGEYLVFWDADDEVPSTAIELLYEAIIEKNADMSMGLMKTVRDGYQFISPSQKKMCKEEIVYPTDKRMTNTLSNASKMFKREIIVKNNIEYPSVRRFEDNIFLLRYLAFTREIATTNNVVYVYERRTPHYRKGRSITFTKDADIDFYEEYLSLLKTSVDNIFAANIRNLNDDEFYDLKKQFSENLFKRTLRITALGSYRRIWGNSDENYKCVKEAIYNIFPKYLNNSNILEELNSKGNRDLDIINKGIMNKVDILDNTKLSFVLSGKFSEYELNNLLGTFLWQTNPFYKIYIAEYLYDMLDDDYKKMPHIKTISGHNVKEVKKNAIEICDSEYIMFFDEYMYPMEHTYKNFLNNVDVDKVAKAFSIPIVGHDGNVYESHYETFTVGNINQRRKKDYYTSNKIFRLDTLKENKIIFTNSSKRDIRRLWKADYFTPIDIDVKVQMIAEKL